jgi:predicted secreted Zn-dependent protease
MIACAIVLAAATLPAGATVTSDTTYRYYNVGGTTEREIVRYMRSHPYQGDNGHAYANLKHRFKLSLKTSANGGQCKVDKIDLDIDFVMTLPRSANPDKLTKRARNSFNGFVNFAKRHEEHHRASFTECGKSFAAKARQMKAEQCFTLNSEIKAALRKMDQACEAKQKGFDRSESKRVHQLALFKYGK